MIGDPYASWKEHDFVMFDVETTGLDPETDRIVEVGLARFEKGKCVEHWGSLVNPEQDIPEEASRIHGISDADVANAPPFVAVLAPIMRLSHGVWPAAYNASFDRGFLEAEIRRLRLTCLKFPLVDPQMRWFDPLIWIRHVDGIRTKNKLTLACERHGVKLEDAHRASADAIAAGHLVTDFLYNVLPDSTMSEMLRVQQMYQRSQDADRRAWFARKGIPYR